MADKDSDSTKYINKSDLIEYFEIFGLWSLIYLDNKYKPKKLIVERP
jgi:hypothetical protein